MDLVVGGAHLTQFFEALGGIADVFTESDSIRLSGPLIQPIAAEDVATMQERRRADLSADPSSFCSVLSTLLTSITRIHPPLLRPPICGRF